VLVFFNGVGLTYTHTEYDCLWFVLQLSNAITNAQQNP